MGEMPLNKTDYALQRLVGNIALGRIGLPE